MNADQFYKELKSLTPQLKDFDNYSIEFAQGYIDDMYIEPWSVPFGIMPENPILDLIGRYDVSTLCIQVFGFFKPDDVGENEKYIYFGNKEGSPLAVEKATGQIAEMDPNEERIICYMAKDQSCFLDFLIALEKLNQLWILHGMTDEKRDKELQKLLPILGGNEYAHGIEDL